MVVIATRDQARANLLTRELEASAIKVSTAPPDRFGELVADGRLAVVVLDGFPAATKLRAMADATAARPSLAILVLGPTEPDVDTLVALASGASGYLAADAPPRDIITAVTSLLAGKVVLPPSASAALVRGLRCRGVPVRRLDGQAVLLTHREWEVLVLLRQARTTAEIAQRFVVSQGTVRTHVATIVRKLGASGREALASTTIAEQDCLLSTTPR